MSFALYLTHFPILVTAVCALFLTLAGSLPYGAAASLSTVTGLALCFAVAALFERHIDRPSMALARMIGPRREPAA